MIGVYYNIVRRSSRSIGIYDRDILEWLPNTLLVLFDYPSSLDAKVIM